MIVMTMLMCANLPNIILFDLAGERTSQQTTLNSETAQSTRSETGDKSNRDLRPYAGCGFDCLCAAGLEGDQCKGSHHQDNPQGDKYYWINGSVF